MDHHSRHLHVVLYLYTPLRLHTEHACRDQVRRTERDGGMYDHLCMDNYGYIILYAQYVEGFLCMCSYYSDDSTSFTTQTTQKEASVHATPSNIILSKILSNLLNATFYCSDSKFALILFTKKQL